MSIGSYKVPLALVGVLSIVFVGCCGILGLGFFLRDTVLHPERAIVQDYLQKNVHDPSSLEFVEWGPTAKQANGVLVVPVKVRAKNAFGAKILSRMKFKVKDGKVVDAIDEDLEQLQKNIDEILK